MFVGQSFATAAGHVKQCRELPEGSKGALLFSGFGRSAKVWIGIALSASIVIAGSVVAGAAVTGKHHDSGGRGPIICRPDGRRTVQSQGVYYIVRNDVFFPERECIKLQWRGAGFVVVQTHADSHVGDNEAFPEVIYGCEWGVCTKHTLLPRRIYRITHLVTSWGASWRRAKGKFNVAYDIWFGHLHTIHGHALGAEMMIWLGTKRFGTPVHARIYRIDGVRWYFGRHLACDIYGCWNYILFRRVVPSTHAYHLGLLPFIHFAESTHQISWKWFLKSIDVGFEIWQRGGGLAAHSFSVQMKLHQGRHRHKHRARKVTVSVYECQSRSMTVSLSRLDAPARVAMLAAASQGTPSCLRVRLVADS